MKKSKLVGLATLFLALGGMAGCSGDNPVDDPECKHENVTQAHDETNHWDVCADCGAKVNEKKHVFKKDDAKTSENKAATCTEAGWTWQICSCGQTNKKEDKALGHNFTKVKSTTATCTEAGENTMECSRCGVEGTEKQPQEALNHDYVKAADQTGAIAPGCEAGGTEKQKCSRCDSVRTVDIAANGHAFGEETSLETAGCATLKKAVCSKDQVERYSFDAKEVTDACKNEKRIVNEGAENQFVEPNYVEDGDGIKFWGRPIRNAMTLDETGSASSSSHTSVFDETVTGSYFEYKINAPEAMTNLKLLAYMMPCSDLGASDDLYLGNTGDWTPGKDAEGNNYKFRYVITINGHEVAWEDYNEAKYLKGDTDWYTFPLQGIALNKGENVIRISMAGGYRSTYYKFALQTQSNEEVHEHAYTNDPEHLSKAATCTEDGRRYGICSCGVAEDVVLRALGHNWVVDRQEGDYDATCTAVGSIHEKCDREGCEETRVNAPAATGHNFEQVGEPIANEGYSTIYKETCAADNITRYRIAGTDVSEASKVSTRTVGEGEEAFAEPNYLENADGSVSFWGRAIGNSQELSGDATTEASSAKRGTLTEDEVKELYDATVYGSFFEYKFMVGADGVKGDLVCEIAQSQWMSGSMFTANWSADWTPGIKDAEGNCYDKHFVVEVDGHEVEWDLTKDTSDVKQAGNSYNATNLKQWYRFPLANQLDLAAGSHTIRFRMASGNICRFYNVAIQDADPEPVTPVTPETTPIKLEVKDATGYNNPADKCKSSGVWTIDGEKVPAGEYSVKITAKCTSGDHSDRKWYNMAKAELCVDGTVEETRTSSPDTADQDDYRYFLKVGDTPVYPDGKDSWGTIGLTNTAFNTVDFVSKIIVTDATDKISIEHGNVGFSLYIQDIQLTRIGDHVHVWNENACACGATRIAISALGDATNTPNNKSGTPEGFLKLGSNGNTAEYSFNSEKAGKAHLVVEAAMDTWGSGNKDKDMYAGTDGSKANIKFTVGGAEIDLSQYKGVKYGTMFPDADPIANNHSGAALIDLGEVDVAAGANAIVIERVASYNILIRNIYIVF